MILQVPCQVQGSPGDDGIRAFSRNIATLGSMYLLLLGLKMMEV